MKRFIWTKERCKEEASKYSSRKKFKEGSSGAYYAAIRNNWLNEFYGENKKKGKDYWTYKRCKEEASKYSLRGDFQKGNIGAYAAALRNNWLNEFYGESKRKRKDYWTYERCFEEAKNYSSRNKFQKGNIGAYQAAKRNGWLDEFYEEKHNLNDPHCVYSYEFITESIKAVYVGIAFMWRIKIRDNEHRTGEKDTVFSFAKKHNIPIPEIKILEEGITIESKNKEEEWLNKKYRKEGDWIILNKAKGGSLGYNIKKWTKENCYKEARKYSSRSKFQKGSGGAYTAAWENNWLKDYKWFVHGNLRWTKEKCKEEASKYSSRYDFQKKSKGAYLAAWKNKWLDEFFPKSAPKTPLAS